MSQNATAYQQAFHDVTSGNNTFLFKQGTNKTVTKAINVAAAQNAGKVATIQGFQTANGWDVPTGLGTPNAAKLANLLPRFIQAGDGAGL
jgi:hypothetical protein